MTIWQFRFIYHKYLFIAKFKSNYPSILFHLETQTSILRATFSSLSKRTLPRPAKRHNPTSALGLPQGFLLVGHTQNTSPQHASQSEPSQTQFKSRIMHCRCECEWLLSQSRMYHASHPMTARIDSRLRGKNPMDVWNGPFHQ